MWVLWRWAGYVAVLASIAWLMPPAALGEGWGRPGGALHGAYTEGGWLSPADASRPARACESCGVGEALCCFAGHECCRPDSDPALSVTSCAPTESGTCCSLGHSCASPFGICCGSGCAPDGTQCCADLFWCPAETACDAGGEMVCNSGGSLQPQLVRWLMQLSWSVMHEQGARQEGEGTSEPASEAELLSAAHRRKVRRYEALLSNGDNRAFWDLVVLTAADEAQRAFYEGQLRVRKERRSIPHARYLVIADPPGAKIGCGGSTLYALDLLAAEYGDDLFTKMRTLIIHAGGYSKRLPNHSATGKIFASVPVSLEGIPVSCSMLEMKLIMFVDFPKRMIPGVFLSCADDIELFASEGCKFDKAGFIALAHPAAPHIGLSHGVFVLKNSASLERNKNDIDLLSCHMFLHKPSLATMKGKGALLSSGQIWVDSNFYFDGSIARRLLDVSPLQCEVDAYGDFLQALGEGADDSYTSDVRNVSTVTESLSSTRKRIFSLLRGTALCVLPLVPSVFIHIGTTQEYIEHFSVGLASYNFPRHVCCKFLDPCGERNKPSDPQVAWCGLNSHVATGVYIGPKSVLEFCTILNSKSTVGASCILNFLLASAEYEVHIPDGVVMQTLPIRDGEADEQAWVTSFFGVNEDFKRVWSSAADVVAFGEPLLQSLNLGENEVWPSQSKAYSLWEARVFPVATTAQESLLASLGVLRRLIPRVQQSSSISCSSRRVMSWAEALLAKDLAQLLPVYPKLAAE